MSGLSWKRFVDVLKAKERKTDLSEQELAQAYDRISILEGELAHVQAENADLRDEMEAMTNGGMRNE